MKKYLALLAGLFLMVSCSESEPGGEDGPGGKNFTVDMSVVSPRTATAKVTPKDVSKTYISVIVDAEMLAEYDTDSEFISWIMLEYENVGVKLADVLSAGPASFDATNLTPYKEYVVAAFGYDIKDVQTLDVEYTYFTTPATIEEPIDCTFDITVTDIMPDGATINIKPSNKEIVYAIFPGAASILDSYGGDAMLLATSTIEFMESQGMGDWGNMDSTESLQRGDSKVSSSGMLKGGEKQIVICFGINKYGEATTEVAVEHFETPMPAPSNCTFELTYDKLSFNGADVKITPSDQFVPFQGDIAVKSFMDGMSEEQFVDAICMNFPTVIGTMDLRERGSLEPDTDYVIFAFGAEAARPTTKVFKQEFRTPAFEYKSGGDAYVEQKVLSIVDGASYELPGYGVVDVLYTPNEATTEYYMAMPQEGEGSWDDLSEDRLKQKIVLSPGSSDHRDDHCMWSGPLKTIGVFYVVGMDSEGRLGVVNRITQNIVLTGASSSMALNMLSNVNATIIKNRITDTKQPINGFDKKAAVLKTVVSMD